MEEDDDALNPFFTVSPPHHSSSSSSYSQRFAVSPPDPHHFVPIDAVVYPTDPPHRQLNLLDDDDFTSSSPNYQTPPRVFDRFRSSSSSSSGDDDENDEFHRSDAARKRLDYMMDYLDRKLSVADVSSSTAIQAQQPLPEFIAGGGGTGMFKLPVRSSVNPSRPPSLELRPHPLRERQVGRFLRNIVCVDDGRQMWAGSECGLRAWDLMNIYGAGAAVVGNGEEKDEEDDRDDDDEIEGFLEGDTAPFAESVRTVGTLCVVGDDGSRMVWSGHKDGKIECWKMDGKGTNDNGGRRFKEWLSWQAHRGPVLCMVMTSHGKV